MAATIGGVPRQAGERRGTAAALADVVRRHAVPAYFVLVFAASWSGVLFLIGPGGFPGTPEQVERLMGVGIVMTAGPAAVGLLLTGLVSGRAGLHDLLGRLLRWRVGARWYAVALGIALVLAVVVFALLSLRFPAFVPAFAAADDKLALLLVATAVGLVGGLLEEVGWTGFAIPRLLQRRGVLATGLLVGVLWGAWHLLVTVWYGGAIHGELPVVPFVALYAAAGILQLTAYRVLMVWLYDRTDSLLLVVLMHAGLIVTTTPLVMGATAGAMFLTWFGGSAAALWVLVAALALAGRGRRR